MTTVSTPQNLDGAAELFDRVWARGRYSGFSHGTNGVRATPFLNAFIGQVKGRAHARPRIAELGAGSGDHAMRLTAEGFEVIAVEASQAAVRFITERTLQGAATFRVLHMDLLEYARGVAPGTLDGVYANSVLHVLTTAERGELYPRLRAALADDGVLAVSFKGRGDALEGRGRVVEETAAGVIVEHAEDRIRRLFVGDPEPLVEELRVAGFQDIAVLSWSVASYNIEGEVGRFVGLLANCDSR
jgi:SAM-dependent methyltransferase